MKKIFESEKKFSKELAEQINRLSNAQRIRVMGIIEGISLAETVDKAADKNETA